MRGQTKGAVALRFAFGTMEAQPQMEPGEREALRQRMRGRYAVHYSALGTAAGGAAEGDGLAEDRAGGAGVGGEGGPTGATSRKGQIDTDAGEGW